MEKIKKEIKKSFEENIKKGLSPEEALSKTIVETRNSHDRDSYTEALKSFLKEIEESYSVKNLTEADPLLTLSEYLYLEYELLLAKIKEIFHKN